MTFKAPWWLSNPHLQTIWPTLFRKRKKYYFPLRRERFELPDGDFVDLDWAGNGCGPIVLILHGLEGSIDSSYAKGMLQQICNQGWRGLFLNFRGCSGEHNRLPRAYHSGDTSDVNFLVNEIAKREPNTKIAMIGFSLGGNVLLKWLGENKSSHLISASVAVSVPFELQKSATRINQGFSKFYQWYFLKHLRKRIYHKFLSQAAPMDFPPLTTLRTLRDFDDKITAPLHGFASAEDYYTRSSSRKFLSKISVPTLIVHAKDDPMMTMDLIPQSQELSPQVTLELTEQGGHVGFVTGKYPWKPCYWIENRAIHFFKEFL